MDFKLLPNLPVNGSSPAGLDENANSIKITIGFINIKIPIHLLLCATSWLLNQIKKVYPIHKVCNCHKDRHAYTKMQGKNFKLM